MKDITDRSFAAGVAAGEARVGGLLAKCCRVVRSKFAGHVYRWCLDHNGEPGLLPVGPDRANVAPNEFLVMNNRYEFVTIGPFKTGQIASEFPWTTMVWALVNNGPFMGGAPFFGRHELGLVGSFDNVIAGPLSVDSLTAAWDRLDGHAAVLLMSPRDEDIARAFEEELKLDIAVLEEMPHGTAFMLAEHHGGAAAMIYQDRMGPLESKLVRGYMRGAVAYGSPLKAIRIGE